MTGAPQPDIAAASAGIEAGRLSPVALTEQALSSAEMAAHLNVFITLMPDTARSEAAAAESRARAGRRLGPLDGIPIALKDVLATAGVRTTAGSRVLAGFVPDLDCPVVATLRQAGAVILGKTNMHEFAYGVTSDNPYYGAVANPPFPRHIVGGSSGGSAAAVAAGIVLGAIGTDTGGSIRIPAAATGLWGLKPTHRLMPGEGVLPQAWSLDHVGPMARSASDLRLMLSPWQAALPEAKRTRAIAIPADLLESGAPTHRRMFESLLSKVPSEISLHSIRLPDMGAAYACWLTILLAESAAYHATTMRRTPDLIGADLRPFLLAGSLISAERYLHAQRLRRDWTRRLDEALGDADALLHPTLPAPVPARGADSVQIDGRRVSLREALVRYQWPANLSGWPALAFPLGAAGADDPPFSAMLTARPTRELSLLDLAERLAKAAGKVSRTTEG